MILFHSIKNVSSLKKSSFSPESPFKSIKTKSTVMLFVGLLSLQVKLCTIFPSILTVEGLRSFKTLNMRYCSNVCFEACHS